MNWKRLRLWVKEQKKKVDLRWVFKIAPSSKGFGQADLVGIDIDQDITVGVDALHCFGSFQVVDNLGVQSVGSFGASGGCQSFEKRFSKDVPVGIYKDDNEFALDGCFCLFSASLPGASSIAFVIQVTLEGEPLGVEFQAGLSKIIDFGLASFVECAIVSEPLEQFMVGRKHSHCCAYVYR